jgi:uncharacterized protein YjbI with pentapeptide repeats
MERDIGTQGGNYAEHVAGHNIHADIVIINEAPSPPNFSPPTSPEEPCRKRKQIAFIINGSLKNSDPTKLAKLQLLVRAIQQLTEDASFDMVDIQEGSIRLVLEGSQTGVNRLQNLFNSGELTEILGFSIRAVEPVTVEATRAENPIADLLKEMLITTITGQGALSCDLSGANLSGANLSGAILSKAILNKSILSSSNLSRAILRGTKLREADLNRAFLTESDLSTANLTKANLREADLRGANLTKANLTKANLTKANLAKVNLTTANLRGADLRWANCRGTNLKGADLRGSNLKRLTIDNETLIDDKWLLVYQLLTNGGVGRNLIQADFVGAYLAKVNLTESSFIKANFSQANLVQSVFTNANLIHVDFSEADLTGSNFTEASLIKADLSGSDLGKADLSGASLIEANLTKANLTKVQVRGTLFLGATGISNTTMNSLQEKGAIIRHSSSSLEESEMLWLREFRKDSNISALSPTRKELMPKLDIEEDEDNIPETKLRQIMQWGDDE